jgi:hypothetical protein
LEEEKELLALQKENRKQEEIQELKQKLLSNHISLKDDIINLLQEKFSYLLEDPIMNRYHIFFRLSSRSFCL